VASSQLVSYADSGRRALTNGTMHKQQAIDRAVAVQGVSRDEGMSPASPGEGHVEAVKGGARGSP